MINRRGIHQLSESKVHVPEAGETIFMTTDGQQSTSQSLAAAAAADRFVSCI